MTKLPARYNLNQPESDASETERISRMITLVSHELKNPLSAIQLTAEMLSTYREHFTVADQEKHLQSLLSNTKLLKELIDKTSTYCRLRFDVVVPMPQQVEVNEFLRNLQIEATEWPDCQHPLSFESKSTPQVCRMDAFQIKAVLENVLRNAMHFSEPGAPIDLKWNLKGSVLELTIADRGVGISEKDLGQVFDPYFRTRDLAGNTGTGLGLTICQQILAKNKGNILLSNNQPTGTAVKIILPS